MCAWQACLKDFVVVKVIWMRPQSSLLISAVQFTYKREETVFLKSRFCWDVALHRWVIGAQDSGYCGGVIFNGQNVQPLKIGPLP
jgi:hypothetical protein